MYVPEGIVAQKIYFRHVSVEVPRIYPVAPYVYTDYDIVTYIVLENSYHEMLTLNILPSGASVSPDGVSLIADVLDKMASTIIIPSLSNYVPSSGTNEVKKAV